MGAQSKGTFLMLVGGLEHKDDGYDQSILFFNIAAQSPYTLLIMIMCFDTPACRPAVNKQRL